MAQCSAGARSTAEQCPRRASRGVLVIACCVVAAARGHAGRRGRHHDAGRAAGQRHPDARSPHRGRGRRVVGAGRRPGRGAAAQRRPPSRCASTSSPRSRHAPTAGSPSAAARQDVPAGRSCPDQLALAAVTFRKDGRSARTPPITAQGAQHAGVDGRGRRGRWRSATSRCRPPMTGPVAQTMRATVTNATTSWTARSPKRR